MAIIIRGLFQQEPVPYGLLLEADPSREKIDGYIDKGICFVAEKNHEVVGIIIIVSLEETVDEILNLAVRKEYRGKGIAKKLIEFAVNSSVSRGKLELLVGTGNSSLDQLAFYQKCGFRIDTIKKNYFIENYREVIIENGIRCMDMIMLKRRISPKKY
ncbi:GNAT family N-acetyltransferase [Metabacillus rhizolycopersici]|uniref:GNAT family N-acetyltransferase n=1 Tax=Metabacillus rhizolycopersici TaxID=2875709 RepID=A0ABS7UKL3_9BACI|nr:GNAT family N-acetyltransferase [Metabacillus rhizolycopersici]MBZ5748858.1 GNAT family N-acetyltransferase [Metabacillus rhizolycopersici]